MLRWQVRVGLVASGCAALACREHRPSYYRAVAIDPATRHLTFGEKLTDPPRRAGRIYFRFDDARNRPGITLLERDAEGRTLDCYDHLALDADHRLQSRSKIRELRRGPFGQLLGETTYYYGPEYHDAGIRFLIEPNASGHCVERPESITPPLDSTAKPDAWGLTLIFVTDRGFRFLIGTYSGEGWLQAVTTGQVARPFPADPDSIRARRVGTTFIRQPPDSSAHQELPARLDLTSVSRRIAIGSGESPVWILIDTIYDRGRLVRQETDSGGTRLPQRWIRFSSTDADSALVGVDRQRTFGQTDWLHGGA